MAQEGVDRLGAVLRPVTGLLANVVVVTALLVYIGWKRAEVQSRELGLSEAIFAMSTQDYVLRSVKTVLVLLIGVGILTCLWVVLDRWLSPRAPWRASGESAPVTTARRWVLRFLGVAWLVLPALVTLMGLVWRAWAFVLLPVSLGVGAVLLLYVVQLRGGELGQDERSRRRMQVLQIGGLLIALVCTFWTGERYAHLDGVRLARAIDADVTRLPGVVVLSPTPLHLDGPGASVQALGAGEDRQYRYEGLRLLEYARSTYFLVSDGWSRELGVVFVVSEAEPGLRIQFLRAEQ